MYAAQPLEIFVSTEYQQKAEPQAVEQRREKLGPLNGKGGLLCRSVLETRFPRLLSAKNRHHGRRARPSQVLRQSEPITPNLPLARLASDL